MVLLLLRIVSYSILTLGWGIPSPGLGFFSTLIVYAVKLLYFSCLALVYRACSWLVLNWFELYQKERARKKLPRMIRPFSSGELTTYQRRKRSYDKQAQLKALHERLLHVVTGSTIFVWLVSCVVSWPTENTVELVLSDSAEPTWMQRWISAPVMPPFGEALLATICLICTLVMCESSFRRLASFVVAKTTKSMKLKRHNIITALLTTSVMLYFCVIIFSYLFDLGKSGGFDVDSTNLVVTVHSVLRLCELSLCAFTLSLLGSRSLSLKAPFPSEAKQITQDWLTHVLSENGHIKPTTTVVGFWSTNLKGGCHFNVCRVNLRYAVNDPKIDNPCTTVVVKLLYWNKPIFDRIILYLKYLLNSEDREVMYLRSYHMEARFYKRQVNEGNHGLKTPQIYYNLEDIFNNRFGMVCEDLSSLEDGQPYGFPLSDCRLFMVHLAQFHAAHWSISDDAPDDFNGWDLAGYWTGDKREGTKSKVKSCWTDACNNFAQTESVQLQKYPQLGEKLEERLDFVSKHFEEATQLPYRTLCHGDYKISNLFVGNLAESRKERATRRSAMYESGDFASSSMISGSVGSANRDYTDSDSDDFDVVASSSSSSARDVFAIDFQWYGLGSCVIDVAAFLATSPREDVLDYIDDLLKNYHDALIHHLKEYQKQADYPWHLFRFHFQVAWVDFCTYCITAKWSKMTPIDFEQYARKQKDGLHLRSYAHMKRIVHRTAEILDEWEQKKKQ
eukprot:CAMPEP_0201546732 /NCGR_PEP_ID=MMETSP0173_2-20130828/3068_1 /ASSEMBLY_ACC=CAM_ASM_000268 /TAXON_ID=218659 /ORGANISM="Vexillifera sp., Strain DIVA3 564/2" /LENGTH=730 /DNA_ID=CAMNT_0047955495 /DNA_START=119 /DNA_END=2311 /DNA_ORIENTATION=+